MTSSTFTHTPVRRLGLIVAAVATAALLVAVTACTSGGDDAKPTIPAAPATSTPTPSPSPAASSTPPTTSSPQTTLVTATTVTTGPTAPPTTAPPTTPSVPLTDRRPLLSAILDSHRGAGEFVGARLALLDHDGTITETVSGTATVDPANGPVNLDAAWNIGSVTKTFVAVVVLQLAEEGKINLDSGIARYLPDLAAADRITPRELLQHTSGLNEYSDRPAVLNDRHRTWTPAELVAAAEAAGRLGEPGGAHHYANTNYVILGEIIEQVTGYSWADEVQTRILDPLGMTDTGAIGDNPPIGYQLIDGKFVDTTTSMDPSIPGPAGAMQSTDRDLLRFAAALAHGTLLSPSSETAMRSFVPGDDYSQFGIIHGYGLGFEQYANGTITVQGHMGTGEAQSAFLGIDYDHGTAVVVMTNTAIPGPQALMALEALTAITQPAITQPAITQPAITQPA